MAFLYIRGNYYHIRVKHKGEIIHQEPTGIPVGKTPKEKKDYARLADEAVQKYEKGNRDDKVEDTDFRSWGISFLKRMPGLEYRPGTIELYKLSFDQFTKAVGNKLMSQISYNDIETFITFLRERGIAKNTIAIRFKKLKAIFNHAIEDGYIVKNPCKGKKNDGKKGRIEDVIARMESRKKKFPLYTDEELKILKTCKVFPIEKAVFISDETGMRENEICNLEEPNLDFKKDEIEVINKPNFYTKTGDIRNIPMSARLKKYLKALKLKPGQYVLGQKYDPDWIGQQFRALKKLKGMDDSRSFHSIRHTFITRLLRKGHPVEKVMKITGIKDYETIKVYIHLIVDDIRKLVK